MKSSSLLSLFALSYISSLNFFTVFVLAGLAEPLSCSAVLVITISLRTTVFGVEAPFQLGLVGEVFAKFGA